MAVNGTINGYHEGLSRDTSKHIPQTTTMYTNENFRIITQDGDTHGVIENVKGNDRFIASNGQQLSVAPEFKLIGHCIIRDDIILFGKLINTNVHPTISHIYLYKYNQEINQYTPRIRLYSDQFKNSKLNFNNLITAIGRYENEYIIKVYWTDNENNMRYMNISPDIDEITGLPKSGFDETDYTRIQNQDVEDFELLQNIIFTQPQFKEYTSGNLMSGMVQYAYRLYNLYGSESMFSPTSSLIPIFDKRSSSIISCNGLEPNKQSQLGIVGFINLIGDALKFDRIEIVSLHYAYYNAVPTINIVDIQEVKPTIQFTDTGYYKFGSIPYSLFTNVKNDFTCKTFDVKDDRLFVGNIKETYFDVDYDARAYRYNSDGQARLYETNDSYNSITNRHYYVNDTGNWVEINGNGQSGSNWNLPETANLINPYNILSEDGKVQSEFIYDKGGITKKVGGTGPNISYVFNVEQIKIESDVNNIKLTTDISNEFNLGIKKGFQHDEIYRFGIILFDNKGRQSFVKWIGDIRIPLLNTISNSPNNDNEVYANYIYPEFTVKNLPLGIMSYQIVYVPHEKHTRTILSQCIANTLSPKNIHNDEITGMYRVTDFPNSNSSYSNYFDIISPEIDFDDIDLNNCRLDITSIYNYIYTDNNEYRSIKISKIINTDIQRKDILNFIKTPTSESNTIIPFELKFDNSDWAGIVPFGYSNNSLSITDYSMRNSTYLIKTNEFNFQSDLGKIGYIRNKIIAYNGNTYSHRTTDIYIPCSNIRDGKCYYGDTVINYHESLVGTSHLINLPDFGYIEHVTYIDKNSWGNNKLIYYIPILAYVPFESRYNSILRHGTQFYKESQTEYLNIITNYNNSSCKVLYLKYPSWIGNLTYEVLREKTVDTGYTDLYLYNKVYSQLNTSKTYVPKPLDWQKQVTFDTRIRYSNLKFNGEERDSWLQFMPNNFNEVDSNYGELNQLVTFQNELFCFQNLGFCLASVNQQLLETTDTGVATVLGQGEVLPKQFNYNIGSTEIGIQNNNKVIKSLSALYWIDTNKRKIYRFAGNLESFNEIKGIKGYLNNTITLGISYIGIYDNEFAEVLFSFNNTTLVFNELFNVFQGWYTFNPQYYIKTPRDILSTNDLQQLWKHNIGNRATWYNIIYPSVLEIIANGEGSVTKEFNNIEYMTEVNTSAGIDVPNETFNALQSFNDYATSDIITLKPYIPGDTLYSTGLADILPNGVANIRRRMRMWRTVVPRVIRPNFFQDNIRFRDAYIKLRFTYNNSDNNKLVVHPINTYYTHSRM